MSLLKSQAKRLLAEECLLSHKICLAISQPPQWTQVEFFPKRPFSLCLHKFLVSQKKYSEISESYTGEHEDSLYVKQDSFSCLILYCSEIYFAWLILWSLISVHLVCFCPSLFKKILFPNFVLVDCRRNRIELNFIFYKIWESLYFNRGIQYIYTHCYS